MTSHPAFRRFAFAYTTTFAVLYAVARAKGLVLFTFYPSLGLVRWLRIKHKVRGCKGGTYS
jgi:hypothetical protein